MRIIYILPFLLLTACNGHRLILMYEEGAAVGTTHKLMETVPPQRSQVQSEANSNVEYSQGEFQHAPEPTMVDAVRSRLP